MTDEIDLIDIAELPPALKLYCRPAEVATGKVSAKAIRERQKGAEGRIIVRAREAGRSLHVAERHSDDRILTTAISGEIETKARTR